VSALYAYRPTDAGDLELAPGDHVTVLEWMNADWARGRSSRTGAEGIFPRSYAKVIEGEKAGPSPYAQPAAPWQQQQMPYHQGPPPPQQQPGGPGSYGNMPMDVSQQGGDPAQGGNSKVNQQGKKFGKKLGNAGKSGRWSISRVSANGSVQQSSVRARVLGRTLSTVSYEVVRFLGHGHLFQKCRVTGKNALRSWSWMRHLWLG